MSSHSFTTKIEALLFALGRQLSHTELAKLLDTDKETVAAALAELRAQAPSRGIVLVDDGSIVELRVTGEAAELIERVRKEEYSREIGKAGLEVLAAILYRGPLTRAEIDFIRGVHSSQTLRTLSMRGLVRKAQSKKQERSFVYEPTTDLLATLGIAHVSELPDHALVREKLEALEQAYRSPDSAPELA